MVDSDNSLQVTQQELIIIQHEYENGTLHHES